MLIDLARASGSDVLERQHQVCIVGGGVAGIVMALELGRRGIDVLLLESGGLAPDAATRDLYRGVSLGLPYEFADGCRSRYLGGSSNCWGGWCHPLEDIDFRRRPWVAGSGWPIDPGELDGQMRRAHAWLGLGAVDYAPDRWVERLNRQDARLVPWRPGSAVQDGMTQFSAPLRAGRQLRSELEASRQVTLVLHANVIAMNTDTGGQRLESVTARALSGQRLNAHASEFVLATGGIENARLLLACAEERPASLGNEHGLVGRYFMEHARVTGGAVRFRPGWGANKLYDHTFQFQNPALDVDGTRIATYMQLTPGVQGREGLLNAQVWLQSWYRGDDSEAALAVIRLKQRLQGKGKPGFTTIGDLAEVMAAPLNAAGFAVGRLLRPHRLVRGVRLTAIVEPNPDPQSRVMLAEQRDALGMRRAAIDWRLGEQVKRTFDLNFALVSRELAAAGVADVEAVPSIVTQGWPDSFSTEGTWHHMGTTRMATTPREGVVDSHCGVHGMHNLHIAGSSVFPTGGANCPTLTVVALALRLADRLQSRVRRIPALVNAGSAALTA